MSCRRAFKKTAFLEHVPFRRKGGAPQFHFALLGLTRELIPFSRGQKKGWHFFSLIYTQILLQFARESPRKEPLASWILSVFHAKFSVTDHHFETNPLTQVQSVTRIIRKLAQFVYGDCATFPRLSPVCMHDDVRMGDKTYTS